MSPDDFTKDVITMNEEHLSENILGQILHYMPTMDELNKLKEMAKKSPIEEFHPAERFAIAVCVFYFDLIGFSIFNSFASLAQSRDSRNDCETFCLR